MSNETVTRIFGGSPLGVLARLILVSILVGVVLSALGLNPFDIWNSVERLFQSIWNMGFDAFRWVWGYFLLGAVIVIPIWLIVRLVNAPRGK
jgi:hypothetical protein